MLSLEIPCAKRSSHFGIALISPRLRILVGDFRKSLPGGSDRFINQFFRVGRGNEESFELTAGPVDPLSHEFPEEAGNLFVSDWHASL